MDNSAAVALAFVVSGRRTKPGMSRANAAGIARHKAETPSCGGCGRGSNRSSLSSRKRAGRRVGTYSGAFPSGDTERSRFCARIPRASTGKRSPRALRPGNGQCDAAAPHPDPLPIASKRWGEGIPAALVSNARQAASSADVSWAGDRSSLSSRKRAGRRGRYVFGSFPIRRHGKIPVLRAHSARFDRETESACASSVAAAPHPDPLPIASKRWGEGDSGSARVGCAASCKFGGCVVGR